MRLIDWLKEFFGFGARKTPDHYDLETKLDSSRRDLLDPTDLGATATKSEAVGLDSVRLDAVGQDLSVPKTEAVALKPVMPKRRRGRRPTRRAPAQPHAFAAKTGISETNTVTNLSSLIGAVAATRNADDVALLVHVLPDIMLFTHTRNLETTGKGQVHIDADHIFDVMCTSVKGMKYAVFYVDRGDDRLGDRYVSVKGADAMRLCLRVPELAGLSLNNTQESWICISKKLFHTTLDHRAQA